MHGLNPDLTWIPPQLFDLKASGLKGSQTHQAVFYGPDVGRGAFVGAYHFFDSRQGNRRPYDNSDQCLPSGETVSSARKTSSVPGDIPRQWGVGTSHQWSCRESYIQNNFQRCIEFGYTSGNPQDVRVWKCYIAVLFAQRVNLWVDQGRKFKKLCTVQLPETSAKARELYFNHERMQIWTDDGQLHEFTAIPERFIPCPIDAPIRSQCLEKMQAPMLLPKLQAVALPYGLLWVENTPANCLRDIEVPAAYFYTVQDGSLQPLELSKPEAFPCLCTGRYGFGLSGSGQGLAYISQGSSDYLWNPIASDLFNSEQGQLEPVQRGKKLSMLVDGEKVIPDNWVFEKCCQQLPGFSPYETVAVFGRGSLVQGQRKDAGLNWQLLVWVPRASEANTTVLYEAVWHQDSTTYGVSHRYSKQHVREGCFKQVGDWVAWFDPLRATRFVHYDGEKARAMFVHYHPRGSDKAQDVWLFPNKEDGCIDYLLYWGKGARLEHWRRGL